MSYPPPPGISNLPPRPPAAAASGKSGFKPAFSAASRPAPQPYTSAPSSYSGASSYAPPPTTQYGPSYGSSYGSAAPTVSSNAAYSYPQQHQQQSQGYGSQSYGAQSYAGPQIKNPFPLPGTNTDSDFDPDMAAQIAQWQSTYVSKDAAPPTTRDGRPMPVVDFPKNEAPASLANPDKKKTVVREGGGKKWTDDSLMEWDPSHLRLFVGNLAGETTDESLLKAFSRWKSVQKARVIRDKRTTKSKGFGFVSFSDADDFFQAAKEMNGKYIQSHPVTVRKANTEIKPTTVKDKKKGGRNNRDHKNKADRNTPYEPNLGPIGGGGITKPGQKTKNGLRLLG